jgi:hypothetical protein
MQLGPKKQKSTVPDAVDSAKKRRGKMKKIEVIY